MKVTKALVALAAQTFSLSPELAADCLNGTGLFRGAHNLSQEDFDTCRVDKVSGMEDGNLTFETLTREGTMPKGVKPSLLLPLDSLDYKPVVGEQAFIWWPEEDRHYTVLIQGMDRRKVSVAAQYDGEAWDATVTPSDVLLPLAFMTAAGPITWSMYNLVFADSNYGQEELDSIADRLVSADLSLNDLYDYLITDLSDLDATKFHKKLVKHIDMAGHDVLNYLKSGELVKSEMGDWTVKSDVEKQAEVDLDTFHNYVDELKGSELKALYASVCNLGKIPEDDRETSAKTVKAHIKDLVYNITRLNKLISIKAYEPE